MKLLKRLLNKDVRAERRFLKNAYRDANHAIFATNLNAATTRRVREGIRRDLDTVYARVKATQEGLDELLTKVGIEVEKREELEKLADMIPESELLGLNDDAREKVIMSAVKRTRELRREWVKNKAKKAEKEDVDKILQLIEAKQDVETSAEKMLDQMRGKWSIKTQQYEAGIDQRLDEIGRQVAGGQEVKRVIKGMIKKL